MNNIEGTRQFDSVTSEERVSINFDRWHKTGSGDCLIKTQESAKMKIYV